MNVSNITTMRPTMDPIMIAMMEEAKWMDGIFRKVLIVQGTLSTLANMIVIAIYLLMGKAQERFSNYLLFCTALSDLFVSAVSWYSYYASLLSMSDSSSKLDNVQVAQHFLYDYSFMLCLGTLLVSSLDRWFSVSNPLRHQEVTRSVFAKLVILPIWTLAAIPALIRLGFAEFDINQLYNPTDRIFNICFRSILIALVFIILVILMMTCIKITTILRRRVTKVGNENGGAVANDKLIADKRNSRVIKIFIGIILSFGITFLPITIAMFLHYAGALDHMTMKNHIILTIFCDVFFFSSSLINPLLTLTFHADFHKPFVATITCNRRKSFVVGNTVELRDTECDIVDDRH